MNIKEELLNNPLKLFQYVGGSVLALVLLSGAGSLLTYRISNPDRTLSFKKEMVLNIGAEKNTISLVSSVGNTSINETSPDYKENKLTIDNYEVSADKVDVSQPGEHTVSFVEKKEDESVTTTKKKVVVKDIEKPTIRAKEKSIETKKSEMKDFKLDDYIKKQDNYTIPEDINVVVEKVQKKEITKKKKEKYIDVEIEKNEIKNIVEAGEYKVILKAEDEAGNTSKEIDLFINVVDDIDKEDSNKEENKQEDEENNEEIQPEEESRESNVIEEQLEQPTQPSVQQEQTPSQIVPRQEQPIQQVTRTTVTAENKVFYTRDYNYSLSALESAVQSYGDSMVNGGRANGYSYNPYTENGRIVGYRITFS